MRSAPPTSSTEVLGAPPGAAPRRVALNRAGWDDYARQWEQRRASLQLPDVSADDHADVGHLGDEWSLMERSAFPYGIGPMSPAQFREYVRRELLDAFLPPGDDLRMVEIGPGGGRLTELLLPRASRIYAVDISSEMLTRLSQRFVESDKLQYVLSDGLTISEVPSGTVDVAISFDCFVHIEPWETLNYLRTLHTLLRPGGVAIIHAPDIETPIGFELFHAQLAETRRGGERPYWGFGPLCKSMLRTFIEGSGFRVHTITNDVFPRDQVAVFSRLP